MFIFINLLIAVINNTISKVDNNKVLYWQFTKASMQGRNSIALLNSNSICLSIFNVTDKNRLSHSKWREAKLLVT